MSASDGIRARWCSHLQFILLTRNCHRVGGAALTLPVAVDYLNLVLPPTAFLRTVSLLDESLQEYIENEGLTLSRGYRHDLNGRIRFLADQGCLTGETKLHELRQRRNEIAHNVAVAFMDTAPLTWADVDSAIDTVEQALTQLSLVGNRPAYEFRYGRDVDFHADAPQPNKPDVLLTHHYYYGIQENGEWVIQFRKSLDYHNLQSSTDSG